MEWMDWNENNKIEWNENFWHHFQTDPYKYQIIALTNSNWMESRTIRPRSNENPTENNKCLGGNEIFNLLAWVKKKVNLGTRMIYT